MSYKILDDRDMFPIVEIHCRDFLQFSVIDLARMVNDIKTQLIAREKERDESLAQEAGWFLNSVVNEDKIAKWSEMDNVVHKLENTGIVPPPMAFDSDGNFIVPKNVETELTDEEINKLLDEMMDKFNCNEANTILKCKGMVNKIRGDTTFRVDGVPLTEDQLAKDCLRQWRMRVKLDKMSLSGKSHEEMKDLGFEAHFLHEALWDQLVQEE